MNKYKIEKELSSGGPWLGEARRWMQHNVIGGDRIGWSSTETVHITFYKLEELAKAVAVAAVMEERKRVANLKQ